MIIIENRENHKGQIKNIYFLNALRAFGILKTIAENKENTNNFQYSEGYEYVYV